jgi:hypothetical protein
MTPFVPLGFHLLKPAERLQLRELVLFNPDRIEMLKSSVSGQEYGLARVGRFWEKHLLSALARLRVGCLIPFEVGIYYVPAGMGLPRHVDWRTQARRSTIITPISDETAYSPTLFYEADSEVPCATMQFTDLPALMNTQEYHAVPVSDQPRINFQVYFQQPFGEIAALIHANKLFRSGKIRD